MDSIPWHSAPWSDLFLDIEGVAKPTPRYETRMKMLWDDEYLYVGADLAEPHVWGTLTKRDSVIFHDNDFEIFIDPDGDNHQYYEIELNALNTVWDLRLVKPYRDGGPALNEWDIPGFRSAVWIDGTLNDPSDVDRRWRCEMAIPWESLGEFANRPAPPHPGEQWRINFSRVEWDIEVNARKYVKVPGQPEHNWVWSPQGVIDMHRPERWGYVQFSDAEPGTEPFEPDPSHAVRTHAMDLYYRQRDFHARHKRFAGSAQELGMTIEEVFIELTAEGYRATIQDHEGGYVAKIDQHSRLWTTPFVRTAATAIRP